MTQDKIPTPVTIRKLGAQDLALMDSMLTLFGEAFAEPETYGSARPSKGYFETLLNNELFVALVAIKGDDVVGGLVAYEWPKFEQERSEFYVYDLGVSARHRRQGIATALIDALRPIAAARSAHVIFVQAERGDEPAIALYSKLGTREDVVSFNIEIEV